MLPSTTAAPRSAAAHLGAALRFAVPGAAGPDGTQAALPHTSNSTVTK